MDEVLARIDGSVLVLTMNRPAKMNAITRSMYEGLSRHLRAAAEDFAIRVVVIQGQGEHFTAGNDIYDFMEEPPTGPESPVSRFLEAIHNFPKPLIAAVQGNAIGIGTTMLFHCEIVFATSSANFSMPFVSLGLVPEAGSSYIFPALAGYQEAARIFLTGDSFGAQDAHRYGLVGVVCEDAQEQALVMAHRIAHQPPTSVINTKALLKARSHDAISAVMTVESQLFMLALQSDEAMAAFIKFTSKKGKAVDK